MSNWNNYEIENKVREILSEIKYKSNPKHHFGKPFASAYQIAIQFSYRYPDVVAELGYQVGGEGISEQTSLAQYIAKQLSVKIKEGTITDIEGGFFSNLHLKDIIFNNNGDVFRSSLTDTQYDLSIFRLK